MDANRPAPAPGGYFGGLGAGSIVSRTIQPLLDSDPRQIGPYTIRGRLGQGAMGHVYLAFAPTGPAYALKVLRPDFASDSDFRRRFAREIAAARAVHSPFVNAVTDADPNGTVPWLASYFIPGPPLNAAVNLAGPFAPRSVAHLGVGIGLALQAIHTAGVVHRDLKPANVLVASDGPRVIDFGIARAADASMLTSTGMRLGTPSFMAPEQVAGANVGAPADVWAVGGMLVYAATGKTPFGDGNAMAILYRVENHEPDLEGLEPALAEIASRCLEKDPAVRPTPAKLVELCRAALDGGGTGIPALPGSDVTGWLPPAISRDLASRAVELASVRQSHVGIPVPGAAVQQQNVAPPAAPKASRGLLGRRKGGADGGVGHAGAAGAGQGQFGGPGGSALGAPAGAGAGQFGQAGGAPQGQFGGPGGQPAGAPAGIGQGQFGQAAGAPPQGQFGGPGEPVGSSQGQFGQAAGVPQGQFGGPGEPAGSGQGQFGQAAGASQGQFAAPGGQPAGAAPGQFGGLGGQPAGAPPMDLVGQPPAATQPDAPTLLTPPIGAPQSPVGAASAPPQPAAPATSQDSPKPANRDKPERPAWMTASAAGTTPSAPRSDDSPIATPSVEAARGPAAPSLPWGAEAEAKAPELDKTVAVEHLGSAFAPMGPGSLQSRPSAGAAADYAAGATPPAGLPAGFTPIGEEAKKLPTEQADDAVAVQDEPEADRAEAASDAVEELDQVDSTGADGEQLDSTTGASAEQLDSTTGAGAEQLDSTTGSDPAAESDSAADADRAAQDSSSAASEPLVATPIAPLAAVVDSTLEEQQEPEAATADADPASDEQQESEDSAADDVAAAFGSPIAKPAAEPLFAAPVAAVEPDADQAAGLADHADPPTADDLADTTPTIDARAAAAHADAHADAPAAEAAAKWTEAKQDPVASPWPSGAPANPPASTPHDVTIQTPITRDAPSTAHDVTIQTPVTKHAPPIPPHLQQPMTPPKGFAGASAPPPTIPLGTPGIPLGTPGIPPGAPGMLPGMPGQPAMPGHPPQGPPPTHMTIVPPPPSMSSPYGAAEVAGNQLPSYDRSYPAAPKPTLPDQQALGAGAGRNKRLALIAAGAVVVVGGIGAAAMAMSGGGGSSSAQPTATTQPPTASSSETPSGGQSSSDTSPPQPSTSAITGIPGKTAGEAGAKDVVLRGLYIAIADKNWQLVCSSQTTAAQKIAATQMGWRSGDPLPLCEKYFQTKWANLDPTYLRTRKVVQVQPGGSPNALKVYVDDPTPSGSSPNRPYNVVWSNGRWLLDAGH